MRRMLSILPTLALLFSQSNVEAATTPAGLNGALYAVIESATDGSSSSVTSFVRFYNGASPASTFTVSIVGSQSGSAYGQRASIQIPTNASVQYTLGQLLALAGSSRGAGSANGDTSFSVYIQDPDSGTGYQHVVFNGANLFLENASVCNNGLLSAATLARNSTVVVTNADTSALGANAYPSAIAFHNYASTSASFTVSVVDAGALGSDGSTISTTAGKTIGQTTVTVPANSTITKLMTDLQTAVSWQPTATQSYANVIVSGASGVQPTALIEHMITLNSVGSAINMTTACSVNNPSSATVYQGTMAGLNMQSGTMSVNISPTSTVQSQSVPIGAGVERTASVERAQSTTQSTSATLLLGTATVTLTGTYTPSTNAVALSGNGYTFTGSVVSGIYSGTYTGPNGASGNFSTLNSGQGAVTAYCGTYTSTRQPAGQAQTTGSGVVNLQVAANGVASGDTTPIAGDTDPGTMTGQETGNVINIVHHSSDGDPVNDTDVTATIVNGSISGSFTTNGGTGTFNATTCSLPSS